MGSGLGYGTGGNGTGSKIGKSVAIKFDLFNNSGEGANSTGLYTNGASPTSAHSIPLLADGINLHSGHPFQVSIVYDGTILTVSITDTVTSAVAIQHYTVNIPNILGGSSGYIGFTGGTGGGISRQDILNWIYTPLGSPPPNAPSGLGATPSSATSIGLTWSNNATNQTGFHLDRATDADFTQNLTTQTIPSNPTGFTDTLTGLTPGGTFFYRLRAFNSAGESANSNFVSVTIPLAPAKAIDLAVTQITETEIDLSWTDLAGTTATGYLILRSADNGPFEEYASLPAAAVNPPSLYEWSDTGLAPGVVYAYHVKAVNSSGSNDFVGIGAQTITSPPTDLTAVAGAARSISIGPRRRERCISIFIAVSAPVAKICSRWQPWTIFSSSIRASRPARRITTWSRQSMRMPTRRRRWPQKAWPRSKHLRLQDSLGNSA